MQDQNVNKERNLRLETKADTHFSSLPLAIWELPCDIILIYVTKILKDASIWVVKWVPAEKTFFKPSFFMTRWRKGGQRPFKSHGLWSSLIKELTKEEVRSSTQLVKKHLPSFSLGLFWLWVVLVLSAAFLVDVSRSQNDNEDNDDSKEQEGAEDEQPFVCPTNSGNHADPKTCRRFYICSTDGAAHRSFCPNGLYWDDEKK